MDARLKIQYNQYNSQEMQSKLRCTYSYRSENTRMLNWVGENQAHRTSRYFSNYLAKNLQQQIYQHSSGIQEQFHIQQTT